MLGEFWDREALNRAYVSIEVRKESTYFSFKPRTKKQSFSINRSSSGESEEPYNIRLQYEIWSEEIMIPIPYETKRESQSNIEQSI